MHTELQGVLYEPTEWSVLKSSTHIHLTYMHVCEMYKVLGQRLTILRIPSVINKMETPFSYGKFSHSAAGTPCWAISSQLHYCKNKITIAHIHWIHSPLRFFLNLIKFNFFYTNTTKNSRFFTMKLANCFPQSQIPLQVIRTHTRYIDIIYMMQSVCRNTSIWSF